MQERKEAGDKEKERIDNKWFCGKYLLVFINYIPGYCRRYFNCFAGRKKFKQD